MKNFHLLIPFLVFGFILLQSTVSAHAQLPGAPCTTISATSGLVPCASTTDAAGTSQSEAQSSQAITDALKKEVTEPQSNQDIADGLLTDQKQTNENYQKEALDAAHKNQDAVLAAIAKYRPSQDDCVNATAKIVSNYGISLNQQRATTLTATDITNLQNGFSGGQYAAVSSVAKSIQAAKQNATSTDPTQLANQPDKSIVEKQCSNSDCYNQWVDQQVKNTLNTSAGDKAPWNAQLNPAMANYFIQRAQWEDTRSAARETVTKLLPKLYKRLDYFTQVQNDYVTSGVTADASSAATRLNLEYPNSSKLGLSYYEMQEAEFNALVAGGQTILHVADNDSQRQRSAETLQADAAALQVAKMERDQLEAALKQLAVPPPPVSASALSITGTTSH